MRQVTALRACRWYVKQGIADLGLFIRDQGHGVMKHGVIVCGTVGHDASQW